MGQSEYTLIKALNNNVVLAKDTNSNKEMILVGKGIGFSKKQNQIITFKDKEIERTFVPYNDKMKKDYEQLIGQLDGEVVGVCEEIIATAETKLGELDPYIHIVLTDHIGFALERLKNDIEINNPFLYEIKVLYKKEFEIAEIGAELIEKNLRIEIPESEKGFIALHLHSAVRKEKVSNTMKNTRIIKEIIEIIESQLKIDVSTNSLVYFRLLNHVKAFIGRLESDQCIENPLLRSIKKEMKKSFKLAKKIGDYVKDHKSIKVPEDELGYLAIHIERMKMKS